MNIRIHRNRFVLTVAAAMIALIFSSCISVERRVKLETDGSGTEELKMIFHREFYTTLGTFAAMFDSTGSMAGVMDSMYNVTSDLNKLREQFSSTEGITLIDTYNEIQPDSSNLVFVKYAFNNVEKIGQSMNKVNSDFEESPSRVTFDAEDGNRVFRYLYENSDTSMSQMGDSAGNQMMAGLAGLFTEGRFMFELDAPFDVVSSNATTQTGRKLVWDLKMSDLISQKKYLLEAVMKSE
ncbi:MAG: hypothetical protein K1X85_10285 [Ignavibacteria bacterium]|nr:hypothetical protein [Ignavibacteria bacterium]